MINELDVPATDLWKYLDDTTISQTISKNRSRWAPGKNQDSQDIAFSPRNRYKLF